MISGAVLAAGGSVRMGTPKLAALLLGKPLVSYALDSFEASAVSEILFVVRPGSLAGAGREGRKKVRLIPNPDADKGMGTSLALAAREAKGAALVVGLGDQGEPGARGDQAGDRAGLGPRLNLFAGGQEAALDEAQRSLAPFALIAFGAGERGQIAAQRVAIEQIHAAGWFVTQDRSSKLRPQKAGADPIE